MPILVKTDDLRSRKGQGSSLAFTTRTGALFFSSPQFCPVDLSSLTRANFVSIDDLLQFWLKNKTKIFQNDRFLDDKINPKPSHIRQILAFRCP